MNYTQLTEKKKVEIDILLKQGLSMRKVASILGISHSTISRYKANIYKKRKINIEDKYQIFLNYLYTHYDKRTCSIEICVYKFKRSHRNAKCPSVQQVSKWKRNNKTVLPISLRPKYINDRNEIGHLEIDSILGKRNEQDSIISIVDRCTRKLWLIKAEYKNEYYIDRLIYNYILKEQIVVKSITVDNGLEFNALGLTAKKLGVKLYKCDPYCSFQRGTNERMNAMVRRFIPKGSSMKLKPQIYLDDICFQINSMPRKIFDFKCAYDIELNYD